MPNIEITKKWKYDRKKIKSKQVENIVMTYFGAFGLEISMNNGIVTPKAINLRDQCLEQLMKII